MLVLQALEGLSDRDATQALATDLRWKVACGLSITDAGFHPTTLTQWRNRLRKSDRPERIFDAVRDVIDCNERVGEQDRRALDSTLLDDAVATQDTVTQLVSMIRRVRKAIPAAADAVVVGDDYETASGKPACAWNDPVARDALVTRLVNDAHTVLAAIDGVDLDDDQQQLAALLALVAGQDVEPGEVEGTWKIERNVAKHRVISTVDPDTRHMHKNRSSYRDGYKAHIAVEPDTGLITACDLTPANEADGPTGVALLADPATTPASMCWLTPPTAPGDRSPQLAEAEHRILIKTWPLARNSKLGDDQFRRDDFVIDHAARTVTCPNDITTHITAKGGATLRNEVSRLPGPSPLHHQQPTAKRSWSPNTINTSLRTGPDGEPTPTSSTTTANTGRSASAPLPGSSPTATDAPPPRRRTQQDSRSPPEPPSSTSNDSSTSDSTTTAPPGTSPRQADPAADPESTSLPTRPRPPRERNTLRRSRQKSVVQQSPRH